jgi:hypothetical protein
VVTLRAQVVRLQNVAPLAGGGEDNHGHLRQRRLCPDPFQHFEAGFQRKLEIEKHEPGRDVGAAPVLLERLCQVIDRLLAIHRDRELSLDAGFCEEATEKEKVVFVVLHEEQPEIFFRGH